MISALKRRLAAPTKALLQRFFLACARDLDIGKGSGPSLVIAPHPDDETLGCGATIAQLRSRGQQVIVVIVTDGAACGRSAILGPKEIAAIRRTETQNAMKALGVLPEDVIFLQFPDSQAGERVTEIEAALGEHISRIAPCQIFSPYGVDSHVDHRGVATAIERLCHKGLISCPLYEYPIWFWTYGALSHLVQPHKLMRLRRVPTQGFLAPKKIAIAAHQSQNQALTGEAGWFTFPEGFLPLFLLPFEPFFEKPLSSKSLYQSSKP
jgi:LmbE family N-acetylglucosaminyl deacetylase